MSLRRHPFAFSALTLGYVFLYAPIIVLILFSFNSARTLRTWTGFSLRWYETVLGNGQILASAENSLIIALCSATIATFLGTFVAVGLTRYPRFRGRFLLSGLAFIPLVIPDVMLGISMALLFITIDYQRGLDTIIIAHATLTTAFVAVVVQARLVSFDRSIEEAGMDLGCPPFEVFWKVTLPNIIPSVITGWLLAFSLSLDDVVLSSLTGVGTSTLPIYILSAARRGLSPEINAISSLLIYAVVLIVIIGSLMIKREASRRRALESRSSDA